MGRVPKQTINAEINRIRRYFEQNPTKADPIAIQELEIKERTYYFYKARIREQDRLAWLEMAKETLEERSKKIMDAIEFANKIDRQVAETSGDDRARVQAANQLIQNNVWAMQLLERGPKIMPKLEGKVIQIEPASTAPEQNQESIRQ
jgi:ATPase subunit of ABC transporter with duplicated ATPase domains